MDVNTLLKEVGSLRKLLTEAQSQLMHAQSELETNRREMQVAREQVTELSSTVTSQQAKLEQKDRQILELLRALCGKQRERLDPDQLLLFEIGELEQLIEEQLKPDASRKRDPRKKHGRRLIPEGLPQEIIEHTLPESERLCPVDGQPMEPIRWEESK